MIQLPIGLDCTITDTFGDMLFDRPPRPGDPGRQLTVRVGIIRLLEATTSRGDTEATALRLKLLNMEEGGDLENAEAQLICDAARENARDYLPVIKDAIGEFAGKIEIALKGVREKDRADAEPA